MALSDNLVSYYSFDSDATDAVGANDLTVNGATNTTGFLSNGYSFDGTNDNLQITSNDPHGLSGGFTVNFWMKTSMSSGEGHLIGDCPFSLGWEGFALRLDAVSGKIDAILAYNGAKEGFGADKSATVNNNSWHMVTFFWDGSASTASVYTDGTSSGTVTLTTGATTSAGNFTIGEYPLGGSSRYNGLIDEVGIWTRALSGSEITELYNSGSGLAYPFSAGGPVFDSLSFGVNF